MKSTRLLSIGFLWMVLIPFVSAQSSITSTLYKEVYAPAETVQWELFLANTLKEPQAKDFSLSQGQTTVALAPFLKKINNNHYLLFFTLPLTIQEGTYDLTLRNIQVLQGNTLSEQSHTIPVIIKKEQPYLSIFPGIVLPGEKFELTITNKGQSTNITLDAPPGLKHIYQGPQYVAQGTSRKFILTLDGTQQEQPLLLKVKYEKEYTIPIYLKNLTQESLPTSTLQPFTFVTMMSGLNRTLARDKTLEGTLNIKNNRNETLDAISITLTGDLPEITSVQPVSLVLLPYQEYGITITVNQQKSAKKDHYEGALVAAYKDFSLSFPMSFKILQEGATTIIPSLNQTPHQTQPSPNIDSFFNYSVQPPQKVKKSPTTLIGFIVVLVLAVFFYILLRKPMRKKQTFDQYIRKVERK